MNALIASKVPLGVSLVFFGLVTWVAGIALLIASAVLPMHVSLDSTIMQTLVWFGIAILWVASALTLAGKVCCVFAPPDMLGKRPLYLAIACACVGPLLNLIGRQAPPPPVIGEYLPIVAAMLGFVFFAKFLAYMTLYVRNREPSQRRELVEKADGLFTVCIAAAVCVALAAVTALASPAFFLFAAAFALGGVVFGIVTVIRYVSLLVSLRRTLENAKAHAASLAKRRPDEEIR